LKLKLGHRFWLLWKIKVILSLLFAVQESAAGAESSWFPERFFSHREHLYENPTENTGIFTPVFPIR